MATMRKALAWRNRGEEIHQDGRHVTDRRVLIVHQQVGYSTVQP